jgi:hypothetical protein
MQCSQSTLPVEGSELLLLQGEPNEAGVGEQQAAAADNTPTPVRRRKNESYDQYKARRDKRMAELYKNLTPDEIERRKRIGQANSNRVPWNKGRKHSPGERSVAFGPNEAITRLGLAEAAAARAQFVEHSAQVPAH